METNVWHSDQLIKILKDGGVAVMPTDTIYGIVGSALLQSTVERIYGIRKRASEKPCIILISGIEELGKFSIHLDEQEIQTIHAYLSADRPTSFVLDVLNEQFAYLHRGTHTLSFRIPREVGLQKLLQQTGPLIAPSANPEGMPPAQNINQARQYFSDSVNIYVDGGEIDGRASQVIKIEKNGGIRVLRA